MKAHLVGCGVTPNLLKPCQKKKGQSFVVMLDFCMTFFEFASAACCKKRHAETEHHNKCLVVLIMSELYAIFHADFVLITKGIFYLRNNSMTHSASLMKK